MAAGLGVGVAVVAFDGCGDVGGGALIGICALRVGGALSLGCAVVGIVALGGEALTGGD